MSARRCAWLVLAAVLGLGCPERERAAPAGAVPEPSAVPAQSVVSARSASSSRQLLVAWLECEECGDGELASVVALGPAVVPTLAAVLRGGMSPAQRAKLTLQLEQRWEERLAYEQRRASEPQLAPRESYVAGHLAARDALYRVRAATALGQIASAEAIEALRSAESAPQRPSVERAIANALGRP